MRAVLPDDLTEVVLVGYSFGGFTASRIAVEHPDLSVAQRVMAASVVADVVEIDTDHGPFREQPERLAELLVATIR